MRRRTCKRIAGAHSRNLAFAPCRIPAKLLSHDIGARGERRRRRTFSRAQIKTAHRDVGEGNCKLGAHGVAHFAYEVIALRESAFGKRIASGNRLPIGAVVAEQPQRLRIGD